MSTQVVTPTPAPNKRASIVKTCIENPTAKTITITFLNEKAFTFDLGAYTADMRLAFALHGLEQKIRDNFAGVAKDAAEDNVDPIDLAAAYTAELHAQFLAGKFNAARAKGEPRETPVDVLAQAIIALATKAGRTPTLESVVTMLNTKTKEERRGISAKADVKAEVARIRAAVAKPESNLDLGSLLGQ